MVLEDVSRGANSMVISYETLAINCVCLQIVNTRAPSLPEGVL